MCLGNPAAVDTSSSHRNTMKRLMSMALSAADSSSFNSLVLSSATDAQASTGAYESGLQTFHSQCTAGYDLGSSPASRPMMGVLMSIVIAAVWANALFSF
jgi:hypothetical protein